MNSSRSFILKRLLERAFDVAGFFDLHADVAIGLGEALMKSGNASMYECE